MKVMSMLRKLLCAQFLSPHGFVVRALLLAVIYAGCELCGWREHTTFISGTASSVDAGFGTSAVYGLIYMLAYFGFVLAAPILILAAAILALWQRLTKFRPPA